MTPTAVEALRRSRSEPETFGVFYRHHVAKLFAHIARRVCDSEVAMDLTSETFAQAYLARHRFRGRSDEQASAWLYRIAGRQLSRYFRRSVVEQRALRRLGIEPPQLTEDEQLRLEELSDTASFRATLRTELERLSRAQREALTLRVVEELSYSEVADRLGISEEAARARVMRGLKALGAGLQRSPTPQEARP